MAAATRQKAGAQADIDKDLHSLMELQEKLNKHSGLQQMVWFKAGAAGGV